MTDTETRELCAVLYELTGWDDTHCFWHEIKRTDSKGSRWFLRHKTTSKVHKIPAYDTDYLLDKLPKQIKFVGGSPAAVWFNPKLGKWQTGYDWYVQGSDGNIKSKYFEADTPRKALLKLAIELIKQKVITV